MSINFISEFISNYGLPIFIVFIIGWILYYVWNFLTKQVKPKLIAVLELLNSLAESVKTARNDIDKLNQKISIITVLKEHDQREDKP